MIDRASVPHRVYPVVNGLLHYTTDAGRTEQREFRHRCELPKLAALGPAYALRFKRLRFHDHSDLDIGTSSLSQRFAASGLNRWMSI